MNTTNNTILITGGTAGIGLEAAKLFTAAGNKVIITGRDKKRLDNALALLPGATGVVSDVSKKGDIEALVSTIKKDFPSLNIVVNNAGRALVYDLTGGSDAFENAEGVQGRVQFVDVTMLFTDAFLHQSFGIGGGFTVVADHQVFIPFIDTGFRHYLDGMAAIAPVAM